MLRATVKGSLLVAAVQGALGGIAFWFPGLSGAVLWVVLMAVLSLLPAIGAALVWLPVAAYLLLTGALWQGLALVAWGVLVIGLVDNLLRPVLVGKDTRMPDYVVMISTLGGVAVYGVNGLIMRPAIAAMFIAVWHIYGTRRAGDSASHRVESEVVDADAPRQRASVPQAQRWPTGVRMTCSGAVALCASAHRPRRPLSPTLRSDGDTVLGRAVSRWLP